MQAASSDMERSVDTAICLQDIPAVNLVSRIEHLRAEAGQPVALSADFAQTVSAPVRSLGHHELKGIAAAQEIFAPA